MASVLKVSEACSLALHTLSVMAGDLERLYSTKEIAEGLQCSENHLSKVLQKLTKAGFVRGTRGPRGGFCLAKDPGAVYLLTVYEVMDGPVERSGCLLGTPICQRKHCILGNLVSTVNDEFLRYFSETTLADLVEKTSGADNDDKAVIEETGERS